MAEENTGFTGINLQSKSQEILEIPQGFKGVNVTTTSKQYIDPSYGFKGVFVTVALAGYGVRIMHSK